MAWFLILLLNYLEPNRMSRILLFVFSLILCQSCIPLRISPDIENYKVTKGKKFKRGLPKRQMFIFEDHKQAGHFYEYINNKFQLEDDQVYDDIPFMISEDQYFFSFYEIDIPDKSINLFPVIFEAVLLGVLNSEEDIESVPEEVRKDNFYIAIEVYNDFEKDCLSKEALSREVVLKYLSTLKKEYLATNNYNELVFKD